jgi:cytochrome c
MSMIVRLCVAAAFAVAAGAAQAEGDAARGEKKFEECAACHKFERADDSLGPSLHGVFGRKAASLTEFRYSGALKRSNITWTPQSMDTFIADPQAAVAGNRMPYAGLADAADRADLIAYLQKTFK